MHVAVDLHAKELGGEGEAGLAVPLLEAVRGKVDSEGAALVFVETDRHADVEHAGLDRVVGREEGRAAGGTAVGDVDELQASEAELADHAVGRASVFAAAESVTEVLLGSTAASEISSQNNTHLVVVTASASATSSAVDVQITAASGTTSAADSVC